MNFDSAWEYFRNLDTSLEEANIVTDSPPSNFFERLFTCFHSKKDPKHFKERNKIFSIAKIKYDPQIDEHYSILASFYKFLSEDQACPATGFHWKSIGFQTNDPSRDIRGTGMLGPWQALLFQEYHPEGIKQIWEYSTEEKFSFPLMVSLFGFSKLTLDIFRDSKIWGYLNKKPDVLTTFNQMYMASFFYFFSVYKSKGYNFKQYGSLKKEIETNVLKDPCKYLDIYINHNKNGLIKLLDSYIED